MKKMVIIALVVIGVGALVYIFNGLFMKKDNGIVVDEGFQVFFIELHKRALADDVEFVGKTIPDDIVTVMQKLNGMTRDQIVQEKVRDLKDTDMSSVRYRQTNAGFFVDASTKDGGGYTWSYRNMARLWIEYNDSLPTLEQIDEAQKLTNNYQLSLYGKGDADFKVIVNGQEMKPFAMSNPDGQSVGSLLYVKEGKNDVVIEIIPTKTGDEITYSYDIYEFPKGDTSAEATNLDEKYKLYSSTPKGGITGFAKTTKEITLPFEISAK